MSTSTPVIWGLSMLGATTLMAFVYVLIAFFPLFLIGKGIIIMGRAIFKIIKI